MGDGIKDIRDRAILLIGFAGGFRRSELGVIMCADIERVRQGLIITLRRSKTDQDGIGRKIGIPYGRSRWCPVAALETWLARRASRMALCSGGSIDMAGSQPSGCRPKPSASSCASVSPPPGMIRPDIPATAYGQGWQPQPRRPEFRRGASASKPATLPTPCGRDTSVMASCSSIMPPGRSLSGSRP